MHLVSTTGLPESFIDFRFIFRIEKTTLEEYARLGIKIASLNDEAQLALGEFLYRFVSRKVPSVEAVRTDFR